MRIVLSLWALFAGAAVGIAAEATVWIGTSTGGGSESRGIYRTELDLETGELSSPQLAAEIDSPGFLALHPEGSRLYSVCRLPDGEGGVAAFHVSPEDRSLELLNTQPTGDGRAAHIAVDRSGQCVFTAQYGGGSVAVFPLDKEGKLESRSALIEHEGSGPNERRQRSPHPHWVGTDPGNRYLFVPDLGIDKVMVYRLQAENGQITSHGAAACPPGAGPRHMTFHPTGDYAYVLNELGMSVSVFGCDPKEGKMDRIQTIPTLPKRLQEIPNYASEIRMHPTGQFLYSANRGHDSISVFRVLHETGKLKLVEHESIRGSWPRHFNLTPNGDWLVAAGRKSNTLAVFRVSPETGKLTFTGNTVHCPAPICVQFQQR